MLSKATMSRLPGYLDYMRCLPPEKQAVSATTVARDIGLGEVQVRKDLAAVCGLGKPKTGYSVSALTAAIESALGTGEACEAVIVGAGKLGMALLGFSGFAQYGITVKRAFDNDKAKLSAQVLPMESMQEYCNLHQVETGIITVPASAAQQAADALIKSGVRAIWCFAVCRLEVPTGVTVQYENLALSLAHLKNHAKSIY